MPLNVISNCLNMRAENDSDLDFVSMNKDINCFLYIMFIEVVTWSVKTKPPMLGPNISIDFKDTLNIEF